MSTPLNGQALLNLIESDLLQSAGTPLLTLLEALISSKGNPFADVAAWGQFVANLQPALVGLEQTMITQLLGAIQTKLQSSITAAQQKGVSSS